MYSGEVISRLDLPESSENVLLDHNGNEYMLLMRIDSNKTIPRNERLTGQSLTVTTPNVVVSALPESHSHEGMPANKDHIFSNDNERSLPTKGL